MSKIMPLKRCSIFSEFSFGELSMLAPYLLEETCKLGHIVTKEGTPSHGLVVIASGHLLLSQSSQQLELRLEMGDSLGEFSLIDSKSSSLFQVESEENTELLKMSPHDFQTLKQKLPALAVKLLEGILRSTSLKVRQISPTLEQISATL